MSQRTNSRRFFLSGGLATVGAALACAAAGRAGRAFAAGASREVRRVPSRVVELRSKGLLDAGEGAPEPDFKDCVLLAMMLAVHEDLPPLDALAEIYPDEPPVSVLVDARAGSLGTRRLAKLLATSFVDMGSPPETVTILDAADSDLEAGGYPLSREGEGPRCHGTEPGPGYGASSSVPGTKGAARVSKVIEGERNRLAVVGRLFAEGARMGPFVIDAALRCADAGSRAEALSDPIFGARLLASARLGDRVGLVLGDLIEVPLGAGTERWRAGEVLAGRTVLAVERIGHTILSNTCKARGLKAPAPHPILAAADSLDLPGARMASIDWRKVAS